MYIVPAQAGPSHQTLEEKKAENFPFVKYLDSKVRLVNKNHLLESMAMSDLKWAWSISFICLGDLGFKWMLCCHLIYSLS